MGRLLIQFPGTTTAKALTETLSKNVIIVDEDLHQLRLHDGSTAGGHLIGGSSESGVPVGTIIPFAGNSIPQGYLLCDGSAISRTTYDSLFAVIGTIYGAGDGNSTFNLPATGWGTLNSVPYGNSEFGTFNTGSLPKITGNTGGCVGNASPGGVFTQGSQAGTAGGGSGRFYVNNFDASRSSTTYWRTDNEVHATGLMVYFLIKYI